MYACTPHLMRGGSSLIDSQIGHSEILADLKAGTPSVLVVHHCSCVMVESTPVNGYVCIYHGYNTPVISQVIPNCTVKKRCSCLYTHVQNCTIHCCVVPNLTMIKNYGTLL